MIRQAIEADIPAIAATYTRLLTYERDKGSFSNWQLGVYPTVKVPEAKVSTGTMYVLEEAGTIRASMILNNDQAEEYQDIAWTYAAAPEQVLVIHTLCILPDCAGHGYGTRMVAFAKEFAQNHGCTVIRIDTYAHNESAKALYKKNGFRIAGWGRILLQGLIAEDQVYLECKVE